MVKDRAWASPITTERLQHIADRYHVSTRTVRRDLQALREAGYGNIHFTEQDIPADIVQP